MSNQEHSQEVKQHLLEQLEASKQAIQELNDDELEIVAGGGFSFKHAAISAAASYFIPKLLFGGGGSSGSSQSQSQSATDQSTTTSKGH